MYIHRNVYTSQCIYIAMHIHRNVYTLQCICIAMYIHWQCIYIAMYIHCNVYTLAAGVRPGAAGVRPGGRPAAAGAEVAQRVPGEESCQILPRLPGHPQIWATKTSVLCGAVWKSQGANIFALLAAPRSFKKSVILHGAVCKNSDETIAVERFIFAFSEQSR